MSELFKTLLRFFRTCFELLKLIQLDVLLKTKNMEFRLILLRIKKSQVFECVYHKQKSIKKIYFMAFVYDLNIK